MLIVLVASTAFYSDSQDASKAIKLLHIIQTYPRFGVCIVFTGYSTTEGEI